MFRKNGRRWKGDGRMNELEIILTEASIKEIDKAIGEIDWLCKYDITDRSSDIAIAALKYVRKLKEMDGDENDQYRLFKVRRNI